MRYPVSLIILFSMLLLAINCNPNNPPKQLKPPKKKEGVTLPEYVGLLALLRKQDKCLDENWEAGHVELYIDGNRICGGLQNNNGSIYNSSKQKITEKVITVKESLWCTGISDTGKITSQDIYSWYRVTNSNPLTGDFAMKHILKKDAQGNVISMDSFTNYNKGDELLCCNYLTNYYCEKIKYE